MSQELVQAMPVSRAILWHPAAGEAGEPGGEPAIFVDQAALAALHEHFSTWPDRGVLGFLVGDRCRDPYTGAAFVIVDSTIRLNQAIFGDRTGVVVGKLWDRIRAEIAKAEGHLIGWYHSHPPIGVTLSAGDIETHLQHFVEPWQMALVLAGTERAPQGGFFRPTAGGSAAACLPFYELVADSELAGAEAPPSVLRWANYRTDLRVARSSQQPAPAAPAADEGPPATLSRVGRHSADAAAPPPAEPAAPPAAPAAPPRRPSGVTAPRPRPAPPPPRSAAPLTGPDDLPLLHVEIPDEALPPRASRPATPAGRAAPGRPSTPTPRPTPRPATPPTPPPRRPSAPPPTRAAPPRPRPSPVAPPEPRRPTPVEDESFGPLGDDLAEPLLEEMVEGEGRPRRGRRWVLTLGAVASVVVLAIAAIRLGVVPLPHAEEPAPPEPAAAPARRPTPRPGAPAPAASPPDAALQRLDQLSDSMTRALSAYGDRGRRFDRGQASCAELVRGLVGVEERWIAYNARGRPRALTLDARRASRDGSLEATVDSVDRHFEQSGCARP